MRKIIVVCTARIPLVNLGLVGYGSGNFGPAFKKLSMNLSYSWFTETFWATVHLSPSLFLALSLCLERERQSFMKGFAWFSNEVHRCIACTCMHAHALYECSNTAAASINTKPCRQTCPTHYRKTHSQVVRALQFNQWEQNCLFSPVSHNHNDHGMTISSLSWCQ